MYTSTAMINCNTWLWPCDSDSLRKTIYDYTRWPYRHSYPIKLVTCSNNFVTIYVWIYFANQTHVHRISKITHGFKRMNSALGYWFMIDWRLVHDISWRLLQFTKEDIVSGDVASKTTATWTHAATKLRPTVLRTGLKKILDHGNTWTLIAC